MPTATATATSIPQLTVRETTAVMRKALRVAFPGVKFSVSMARGTAYGWIDVAWTDGPTGNQVEAVTRGFQSAYFDGMDDSYHQTAERRYSCRGVEHTRRLSEHP